MTKTEQNILKEIKDLENNGEDTINIMEYRRYLFVKGKLKGYRLAQKEIKEETGKMANQIILRTRQETLKETAEKVEKLLKTQFEIVDSSDEGTSCMLPVVSVYKLKEIFKEKI